MRDALYARPRRGDPKDGALGPRRPPCVFLGAVAILVVPHIPFNFVPTTDARHPVGQPALSAGHARSLVTNAGGGRIESFLLQRPEVETVQTLVGRAAAWQIARRSSASIVEKRPR